MPVRAKSAGPESRDCFSPTKVAGHGPCENSDKHDIRQAWNLEHAIRLPQFFLDLQPIQPDYRMYNPKEPEPQCIWDDAQRLPGMPRVDHYFPPEFSYILKAPAPLPRALFLGPSFSPHLSLCATSPRRSVPDLGSPPSPPQEAAAAGPWPRIHPLHMGQHLFDAHSLPRTAFTSRSIHRPKDGGKTKSSPAPAIPKTGSLSKWGRMDQFPAAVQEAMNAEREHARVLIELDDVNPLERAARLKQAAAALTYQEPQYQAPCDPNRDEGPAVPVSCTPQKHGPPESKLRCGAMYSEHTESATISSPDQTFRASDIPNHPEVRPRIDAFLQEMALPPFGPDHYSYFFSPGVTKTALARDWTRHGNATIVIHPKYQNRSFPGYPSRDERQTLIPILLSQVQEQLHKTRCQLGILQTLNGAMRELWEHRAMRMYPHAARWKQLDSAPNAFSSVLLRLLRRAEEEVARLTDRRSPTNSRGCPTTPFSEALAHSSRDLAAKRTRLMSLEQELARARQRNAELRGAVAAYGGPRSPEMAEEQRRRYRTIAEPMFRVWGSTAREQARRRVQQDVAQSHECGRNVYPARWEKWSSDVDHILADAELVELLSQHGMTPELLSSTRHPDKDASQVAAIADAASVEEMATAVTHPEFNPHRATLENLFCWLHPDVDPYAAADQYRARYRNESALVDKLDT